MSFGSKIKLLVGRVGVVVFLWFRIYALKSHLYRLAFERRYRNIELSTYERYEDLAKVLGTMVWTADGPKELWDTISSPQKVEYLARWSLDKKVGDCDEFAIYIVAVMNKSLREGKFIGDFDTNAALLLTVTWMKADGEYGGHNVALLCHDDGRVRYMDYGMPSPKRERVSEVVQDVMNRYAPGGTVLAYAISTENLVNVRVSW